MKTTVEEIHIPIGDGKVESIYFNEFVTKEEVIDQLKATAKESTLLAESEAIKQAIAEAKPEVDTTNIASKDLERFFGVKPIEGYEFMTAEEVCSTLEEIVTTMDINLTPEQAKEITNNTLNKG